MKSVLELKEIKKLYLGVELAVVNLHLADPIRICTGTFTIESTGTSFRLISEHDSAQLFMLVDWLREDSNNYENLITNRSEIILFAKDAIKKNTKLKERVVLI